MVKKIYTVMVAFTLTWAAPYIGAWLSLVERFVRDEEVASSNLVAPTFQRRLNFGLLFLSTLKVRLSLAMYDTCIQERHGCKSADKNNHERGNYYEENEFDEKEMYDGYMCGGSRDGCHGLRTGRIQHRNY